MYPKVCEVGRTLKRFREAETAVRSEMSAIDLPAHFERGDEVPEVAGALERAGLSLAQERAGSSRLASTAMMATTTSNSTRVKPRLPDRLVVEIATVSAVALVSYRLSNGGTATLFGPPIS